LNARPRRIFFNPLKSIPLLFVGPGRYTTGCSIQARRASRLSTAMWMAVADMLAIGFYIREDTVFASGETIKVDRVVDGSGKMSL
jgi:hypothetical protein